MTGQPTGASPGPEPMRITLSPSAVTALEECRYKFAAMFLLRLPAAARRPIRQAVFGQIVHAAIADFLLAGGWAQLSLDDLRALLAARWRPDLYPPEVERANWERADAMAATFYSMRYAADATRELGVELRLEWPRHRRGILAVGKVDRVVMRADRVLEVIDLKTSSRPQAREALLREPASLLYVALAADAFRDLRPARVVATYQYLAPPGLVVTVGYDRETFVFNWGRIERAADRIREGIRQVLAGMPVRQAFPHRRGEHCRCCPFDLHCGDLLQRDGLAGPEDCLEGGAA